MEHQYDNDIELLDAYLNGTMTAADRQELEARLAREPELAAQLRLHKLSVAAVQQGSNAELGRAMKGMSRDEMQRLLASKRGQQQPQQRKRKPRLVWVKWAASIAAVLVVGLVGMKLLWPHKTVEHAAPARIAVSAPSRMKPMALTSKPEVKDTEPTFEYDQEEADVANAIFAVKNGVDLDWATGVLQSYYDKTHEKEAGIALAQALLQQQEPEKAVEVAQDLEHRYRGDSGVDTVLSDAEAALNS